MKSENLKVMGDVVPYQDPSNYPNGTLKYFDVSTIPPALFSERLQPFAMVALNCCGLRELHSNSNTIFFSKKTFQAWLVQKLLTDHVTSGVLIATATEPQVEYKKWLLDVGFTFKEKFFNHNTGREVNLYFFYLPKKEVMNTWIWNPPKPLEIPSTPPQPPVNA